jgi:hypothetical protein
MALSNWLTRNEWSASYIAGIWLVGTGQLDAPSASEILHGGICYLDQHGYTDWTGISVGDNTNLDTVHKDENGKYGVNACIAEGDNSDCLLELMGMKPFNANRFAEVRKWVDEVALDAPEFVAALDEVLQDPSTEEK